MTYYIRDKELPRSWRWKEGEEEGRGGERRAFLKGTRRGAPETMARAYPVILRRRREHHFSCPFYICSCSTSFTSKRDKRENERGREARCECVSVCSKFSVSDPGGSLSKELFGLSLLRGSPYNARRNRNRKRDVYRARRKSLVDTRCYENFN